MGKCRSCCTCCGYFWGILAIFVGLMFIPAVHDAYWKGLLLIHPEVLPTSITPGGVAYLILFLLGELKYIPEHGPEGWLETFTMDQRLPFVQGAFGGDGLHMAVGANPGLMTLYRVSYESNRKFYYDPNAPRVYRMFIGAIDVEGPKGKYFAKGVMPTLLQLDTNDTRWWQIRDLWSATIPALQRYPPTTHALELPTQVPGLTAASFCKGVKGWNFFWSGFTTQFDVTKLIPKQLMYMTAHNLFYQAFGVRFTAEELDMVDELNSGVGMLLAGNPSEASIKRGLFMQETLEKALLKTEFSKTFLAGAKKRGLDGNGLIRNLILSFIAAGYLGTGNMATRTIGFVDQNPEMIAVFKKDKEAFMLEAIRLFGGGGGGSVWTVNETTTWTLGSGIKIREDAGMMAMSSLYVANQDPSVFGGPSNDPAYAMKFVPGRKNAERLLSWMTEIGDIRKCPDMTGCKAAPRFCPGAELSQRLGREMVDYYIDTCTAGGKNRDEM